MKVLLGLFLCLGLTVFVSAQKHPCELTLNDVPIVRGMRLGMSQAELAKILPAYKGGDGFVVRKEELQNFRF